MNLSYISVEKFQQGHILELSSIFGRIYAFGKPEVQKCPQCWLATRVVAPSSQAPLGKEARLRMVQVLPLSPPRGERSLMSSLSRLMILLSQATTDTEKTRVNFKWLSMKTFVFSLFYFGFGASSNLVAYLTGFTDQMSSLDPTKNIIDVGSQFASFVVLGASQTFPFFFTSGIPSISGLALAKDLTTPKYGLVFILGSLLTTFATIPGNCIVIANVLHFQPPITNPNNKSSACCRFG